MPEFEQCIYIKKKYTVKCDLIGGKACAFYSSKGNEWETDTKTSLLHSRNKDQTNMAKVPQCRYKL